MTNVKQLLKTANLLLDNPGTLGVNLELNEKLIIQKEIQDLFEIGQEFHKLKANYNDRLLLDAHKQNFHNAKIAYEKKGYKWFKFFYADFRKARKQLFGVLKTRPSSISEQLYHILRKKDAIFLELSAMVQLTTGQV